MCNFSLWVFGNGCVDFVLECVGLRYYVQELSSESFSLKGSFDESGEVDDFDWNESPSVYACGFSWLVGDIPFSAHEQGAEPGRGSVWLLVSEGGGGPFLCSRG